jgi:hypothetical protein
VRTEPVYQITGARSGLSEDVRLRTRKYLISMAIRTACFVGAVIATGPARWVLIAGSLVLPWVAVVVANAGRAQGQNSPGITVLELKRTALEQPTHSGQGFDQVDPPGPNAADPGGPWSTRTN